MVQVLSEQATVKVNGKWLVLKAVLMSNCGGNTVVYIDAGGNEVHTEPHCRSQFKNIK